MYYAWGLTQRQIKFAYFLAAVSTVAAAVVSAAAATVVSFGVATTAAVSAVSVVASADLSPLQETINAAIAAIARNFFMVVFF
jgi:hypothetical protein